MALPQDKSELTLALEKRARECELVELPCIGDGSGGNAGPVAIRLAMLGDEIRAQMAGAAWLVRNSREAVPQKALMVDVGSAVLAYNVCRDRNDPDNSFAWPSFQVMWDQLSADEFNHLIERCNDRKLRACPEGMRKPTAEEAESYLEALADMDDEGAAELLMDKGREWMIGLVQQAAKRTTT
ncbi:MAG: hypothetical protein HOW73_47570 [Polyangiaceae bacterium]|nr:hypothetical protein [Polyangiaceae bacterium]